MGEMKGMMGHLRSESIHIMVSSSSYSFSPLPRSQETPIEADGSVTYILKHPRHGELLFPSPLRKETRTL